MNKFLDRVSLYDFLGYIIPGAIVMSLVLYIADKGGYNDANEFIESMIFILVSYFIGIIIHEIGYIIEKFIFRKRWKGMPSVRFLRFDDRTYENETKLKLLESLKSDNDETKSDKEYQYLFDMMRVSIMNDNRYSEVELFNGLYGMYRSFFTVAIIMLLITSTNSLFTVCSARGIVDIFLPIVCFFISGILYNRTKRFSNYYAKKVIDIYINDNIRISNEFKNIE